MGCPGLSLAAVLDGAVDAMELDPVEADVVGMGEAEALIGVDAMRADVFGVGVMGMDVVGVLGARERR